MASAISSAGGRFRPLPATCDASTPRSGDGRSTDARGLRLFPLPGPDAVFPIPQDALLWTYWVSPESDRGRGLDEALQRLRQGETQADIARSYAVDPAT